MLRLKTLIIFLFCSVGSAQVYAQLATSTALTPAQLVQNVLLGTGVTATNITYTGALTAIGSFDGTNSNIGFAAGVLMTTGNVSNAIGPNNASGISTLNLSAGDPDLNLVMSPIASYDACILEFDFVAPSDTLQFRYIFGSDEYMEYVSSVSTINDAFGFFISGPGISGPFSNGAQNIAIIPGTSLPVTMKNLNLYSYGQFYFDNGNNGVNTTPGGATVQYDGFTKPLTATAMLQCGQKYHIKIAIADGSDYSFDSGVFLEAGSFTIPNSLIIDPSSTVVGIPGQIDTIVYEGCGFAQINLIRSGCNLFKADTIHFTIAGTAQNGVDYSLLQSMVTFPANIATGSFVINSLPDALVEGNETIIITFPNGKITTIVLIDSPPLSVKLTNDTTIYCTLQNLPLTAIVSGGLATGAHTYSWVNTTGTTATVYVDPTVAKTYYLTVTDACGNTATDSVTVTLAPYIPMQLTLNHDTTICYGTPLLLDVDVTDGAPGFTYTWSPNISSSDHVYVRPFVSTNYIITITDVCGKTVTDNVNIAVSSVDANFNYTFVSNQQVDFINQSSASAVSYLWNFGDHAIDSTSAVLDPSHNYQSSGTYTISLVAINNFGCTDTAYQTVSIYPDFYFYYPNAFSPNGNGHNDVFKGYGVGIKTYKMQIFNRWGEKIFESRDLNEGWDGTFEGKKEEEGVYVVKFNVSGFKENIKEIINHITLIR